MLCKSVYFSVLLVVIYFHIHGDAAKILAVFPMPSISHQVVFRPLTKELVRRGHQVTVITPDPAYPKGLTPKNLTEIDLHDISYDWWRENFVKNINGDQTTNYEVMKMGFTLLMKVFEMQLQTKEVQDIIHSQEHFDLILIEACARPALIMSHVFKAPVILISSLGSVRPNYEMFGVPSHPILYPELTRKRLVDLSFLETIEEAWNDFRFRYLVWMLQGAENAMLRRNFGPNIPSVTELYDNVDLLMLNVHLIWENNRPVPLNVVYIGGMHQPPQKPLPSDLKSYLDESKKGVIYMSFGTNVSPSRLPAKRIQLFNKVFSKLPYNVLWRWDNDTMPGKPKNVRIAKWVPQSDLLRHPNVKLFITQAGLQSTEEAITAGVPLIAFPMLGDQWYNAEHYVKHKIGLKLDFLEITEKKLKISIYSVIMDHSYHKNIVKLRNLMQDQPNKPLDRAVWWTEYVIRHKGAKHLRSPAANMSWAEYLILDAVVSLSLIISVMAYALYQLLKLYISIMIYVKVKIISSY